MRLAPWRRQVGGGDVELNWGPRWAVSLKYTVARPAYASDTPIQLMPVPLNVIDARAPRVFVSTAWPPVFVAPSLVYQLPL